MNIDPCMAVETTRELYRRVIEHGVDEVVLLEKSGINLAELEQSEGRFPVHSHLNLWQVAEELLSHQAIGLLMGSESNPSDRGIVGLTFLASQDLRAAVQNKIRYTKILADHIHLEFSETGDSFVINYSIMEGFFHRYEIERVFSGFFNWVRIFVDEDIYPVSLHFQYAEPASIACYKKYFNCPMFFDEANNSIAFSKDLLIHKNKTYNDYPYGIFQYRAESVLSSLDNNSNFLSDVRSNIAGRLSRGNFSAGDIAAVSNLGLRSFHRRLKGYDATYQQLLDDVRKDVAMTYLNQKDCCNSVIPSLLGYADGRAFQRAFKRWTGYSLKQYMQL
ncbi:MAG: AraC-like DNA-binding protein [Candidatus Endobugula sp.]|jgi:AraC-like DNA-binding protein